MYVFLILKDYQKEKVNELLDIGIIYTNKLLFQNWFNI